MMCLFVYARLVPAIGRGGFLDRKIKSGLMVVANELNCSGDGSCGIYNTKLLPLSNITTPFKRLNITQEEVIPKKKTCHETNCIQKPQSNNNSN